MSRQAFLHESDGSQTAAVDRCPSERHSPGSDRLLPAATVQAGGADDTLKEPGDAAWRHSRRAFFIENVAARHCQTF